MANYRNDLEHFIYEFCYDQILQEASAYVSEHPVALDLTFAKIKYPDAASLQSLILEHTTNIILSEDTIAFDAIASCIIELSQESFSGIKSAEITSWLRISCEATITDKLDAFIVQRVSPYNLSSNPERDGVSASANIVPIIRKDELDQEAEAFLKEHYAQALDHPCPVPILEIARDEFHLDVLQGKCITNDLSIFGQICFAEGEIELYDPFQTEESEKRRVKRGTVIIDAKTFFDRNIGCVNNTLAHEVYHWYRHRLYAAIKMLLQKKTVIAHRCPVGNVYPADNEPWTDEQRMEWQANKIAPRILMPLPTFVIKVNELLQQYGYEEAVDKESVMECIIDELSEFYRVSKQSAKIRMIDAGYTDAEKVYNYSRDSEPQFASISARDAFYEYHDNSEFQELIDSGLFAYVTGFFVINDPKFVELHSNGELSLTSYAWNNLGECTLQFTYRKVNIRRHGEYHTDVFHRKNGNTFDRLPHYDASKNASVVAIAADLQEKRAEFEAQYAEHQQFTRTFWQRAYEIMKAKKWKPSIFCDRTGLNEVVFSRAKNNHDSLPDVRTVMSICSGLDLDIGMTNELLSLAGHSLSNSREHQAYAFVITGYKGRSLDEKNEFLRSIDVPELGSKQRK